MLRIFNTPIHTFDFKNKQFEIYDKHLIPQLLGKRGNQTAINTAGSAWKKIIHRNETKKQQASEYRNPKYDELLLILDQHLTHKSDLFNYLYGFREINVETLTGSQYGPDMKLLNKFDDFRNILSKNLVKFKSDPIFRTNIINQICNERLELKKDIPLEYTYIVLCLYIAKNYSCFDKNQYKNFILPIFKSKDEYIQKYFEVLNDVSYPKINNLTCFCYTQYFWFDFRLSDSDLSIIHSILFGMFEEINIFPSTEFTLEELNLEDESQDKNQYSPKYNNDNTDEYPNLDSITSSFICLEIERENTVHYKKDGTYSSSPRIIDFEIDNKRNKKLGDHGELIVYNNEINFLKDGGRSDLSRNVIHVAKIDDTVGYDILSFELDGTKKYIEVKTTNSKPKYISFYISSNEYKKALDLNNYYIYMVFEAKTQNPKIWPIKDPFKIEDNGITLIPIKYRAIIKAK